MIVDINKINFYMYFRANLFIVPFTLAIYFYMIYDEVGVLGLSAIVVVTVCFIIQNVIDHYFKKANLDRMKISDQRGKRINEIITGIKIVKFSAWESILNKIVTAYRSKEGSEIWKTFTLFNLSHAVSSLIPTALGLTIFTLYEKREGKQLDVATIYKLITLFNSTLIPIRFYIMGILGRADSIAASERLDKLVKIQPLPPQSNSANLRQGEIKITKGCFNWEDAHYHQLFEGKPLSASKKDAMILDDININIKPGEFVAVVGKVGSGKSSLVLSMMEEMVTQRGLVEKNGRIAYISQETFLQNATIRDNITFGSAPDEDKFRHVIKIC